MAEIKKMSEKIVELRKSSGLSREEFCEKFKIKRTTLCNWEAGIREPMVCIPFMIDWILKYEKRYKTVVLASTGEIDTVLFLRWQSLLSQTKFCKRYRIKLVTLKSWERHKSEPMECIPFMIRRLMDYETVLGDMSPSKEWEKYSFTIN